MTHESLAEGLIRFYASQAELVLAQYKNINQLLGPTTDWTHPGTHCEVLLRDFLRQYLLRGMSVDKGYVFGRAERDGQERHGPEIDILIHDTSKFRPVFRLEDFVIVQPEALLGMIQVKRAFRSGKDGPLAQGIRQIVNAKQHILDVAVQQRIRDETAMYGGADSRIKPLQHTDMMQTFTAVVSFEDETDRLPDTYRKLLSDAYRENRSYAIRDARFDTSIYVMPDFVGSLSGISLYGEQRNVAKQCYKVFESVSEGTNVGLQMLLARLTDALFYIGEKRPPFAFPKNLVPVDTIQIPLASESSDESQKAP